MSTDAAKEEAADYLRSLLNKNLRVTTTDSRMFCGQFKCTDPVCPSPLRGCGPRDLLTPATQDSNVILAHTYEYRQPSAQKMAQEAAKASESSKIKLDMTSRYLGLVVVPGQHVTKIEVEEFASQMKGRVEAHGFI